MNSIHPSGSSSAAASTLPLEQLAANKTLSEREKLTEVSREFEAVLLRQILGEGRKTVFHSKLSKDSATSAIYQDMVTSQLADGISRSGSFGLARSLETQLASQTIEAPSQKQIDSPEGRLRTMDNSEK